MIRILPKDVQSPLGDISSPAPSMSLWLIGMAAAVLAHVIAVLPFLPEPAPEQVAMAAAPEGPEIGVRLAPMIKPPEAVAPPPEPEQEPERQVIEERASDSPPPAPPAKPREIPDLPNIQPRSVPDVWLGSGGSGGGGLTLEEYLQLKAWLEAARRQILESLVYPYEARQKGMSGTAEVIIVADRNGRIVSWSFKKETGFPLLDREISSSISAIRRLPKFPEGTKHDTLSFIVPIRFELVDTMPQAGREEAPAPGGASAPPQRKQPDDSLSVAQLRYCAGESAQLTIQRDAIDAKRQELEAMHDEYEKKSERYRREQRSAPPALRKLLKNYNQGIEEYNAMVDAFQAKAQAFSAQCGAGSANWENYSLACTPYRTLGNRYCEAFGELWQRLSSQ